MKVGDIITEKYQMRWQECQVCGLPASWRITYLVNGNCRANPASAAYGRDDCSRSSDAEAYTCKKHRTHVEQDSPSGMSHCASFPLSKYKSMGFYRIKLEL